MTQARTTSTRAMKKAKAGTRAPTPVPTLAEGVAVAGVPDYAAALALLEDRLNVEAVKPSQLDTEQVFRLDRMLALSEALGNPHADLRCVHVAGSKGKGSVCEMTAACLEACGCVVGLFTSPHLTRVRERIRLNRSEIPEGDFARAIGEVHKAAAGLPKKLGPVTYFEMLTAAAFLYFAQQAVDIAVIEVGMGGLYDATNIIRPEVSAITSIQLEHTRLLGTTLAQIAVHKAGIIKSGAPAVSTPQAKEVLEVLRARAADQGTTLEVLGEELDFSSRVAASPHLGAFAKVVLTTPRSNFEHLPVPLRGEHQAPNCGLALAILDRLRTRGIDTPEALVAKGLERTSASGRMEIVHRHPTILIDGAHNPESIQALVRAVGMHLRFDSMIVVFGCMADKDINGMLSRLASGADKIFFTRPSDSPRAADPRDLARRFNEIASSGTTGHKMVQVAPTLREALQRASQAVDRHDLIVVTGSFAVAGEAKRLLQDALQARRETPAGNASIVEVKPGQARGPKRR